MKPSRVSSQAARATIVKAIDSPARNGASTTFIRL
jgi:hypothetical protein